MAARDRYSRKLECLRCGNTGFAEASEEDDPRRKQQGFMVDQLPSGFSEERASRDPAKYMIRCRCGDVFPFKQKSRYAPGGEPRHGD